MRAVPPRQHGIYPTRRRAGPPTKGGGSPGASIAPANAGAAPNVSTQRHAHTKGRKPGSAPQASEAVLRAHQCCVGPACAQVPPRLGQAACRQGRDGGRGCARAHARAAGPCARLRPPATRNRPEGPARVAGSWEGLLFRKSAGARRAAAGIKKTREGGPRAVRGPRNPGRRLVRGGGGGVAQGGPRNEGGKGRLGGAPRCPPEEGGRHKGPAQDLCETRGQPRRPRQRGASPQSLRADSKTGPGRGPRHRIR
ncbi:MAG: hypothetical protein J3K34DRAFT_15114 [Monoraphidium minutum]|nr:MAG: hypothetical protein J3K34DRAFT_15114 [Monoraphidium minutum]